MSDILQPLEMRSPSAEISPDAVFSLSRIAKLKRQPSHSYFYTPMMGNKHYRQGVNESAMSILEGLNAGLSVRALVATLAQKYSEPPASIAPKVSAFLAQSVAAGLLKPRRPTSAAVSAVGSSQYWTPDFVLLELTAACRLNCRHCYLGDKTGRAIPSSRLRALIAELVELGVDTVQLTGGEPLLHPCFEESVASLSAAEIEIVVTTSGMCRPGERARMTAALAQLANGRGLVQVSLDGLEAHHNAIRQHPESFKEATALIRDLSTAGVRVTVATVIDEDNIGGVRDLCALVKSLGASAHRLSVGIALGNSRAIMTPELHSRLIDAVTEAKANCETPAFSIVSLSDAPERVAGSAYPNCGCGSRLIAITPELDVVPCATLRRPLSSLRATTLKDGLTSARDAHARTPAPDASCCGPCRHFHLCNGCIAQAHANGATVECSWLSRHGGGRE